MSATNEPQCTCTGATGIRVMLWRVAGQNPHDRGCPRFEQYEARRGSR